MVSKSLSLILIFLIFIQYTLQIDYAAESLRIHEQFKGKLTVKSRVAIQDKEDLSIAYTPGVAEPCKKYMITNKMFINTLLKVIL